MYQTQAQYDENDMLLIPAFLTNSPDLTNIKKYVSYDRISHQQKWFIHLIYQEHYSRDKVQATWTQVYGSPISKDAMRTCVLRTA